MSIVVRVVDGRVEEYENGMLKKTWGSGVRAAVTNGHKIVIVNSGGHIEEHVNGGCAMSYGFGSEAVGVQLLGDVVVTRTSNGRTEEYQNGTCLRSY